jgi:hypothetical protein
MLAFLRVMVGGVTSFNSSAALSLLHAANNPAAVQRETATGDMEPVMIHATMSALLRALDIFPMIASVLLKRGDALKSGDTFMFFFQSIGRYRFAGLLLSH